MKPAIAILAALPREIAPLVRGWPVRAVSRNHGVTVSECDQAIAVCAGIGRERVAYALRFAAERRPLREVISVGYAGALHPGIAADSVHWVAAVIDAETGTRYDCAAGTGTLLTANHVVGREEKSQLAARWNADLVDMEAAAVARLAAESGLRFRALKVVSDEANESLPDFNRFIDARGGFRQAAFAAYIALHPALIPEAIRLGRRAASASQAIADTLRKVVEAIWLC